MLTHQQETPPGHLVELGTYLGKSAVVVGEHRRPAERFVVVDLFESIDALESTEVGQANLRESLRSYRSLTRRAFERNYLAVRGELPDVVAGLSSEVVHHLDPQSVRFMHVDASHLYEAVRGDVESARLLLRPGGLVVFDDIRSEHTPGVTAAVWEAVFTQGLIPVALTTQKLYGVFSDPEPYRAAILELAQRDERIWHEVQQIAGQPVIRLGESARARQQRQAKSRPAPPPPAKQLTLWQRVRRGLARRLR
nr:class I SAM-dependent methyltransferase [Microlunatus panaciterrae]